MASIADEVSLIVQAQDWLLLRSYFANKFSLAFRTSDPAALPLLAETALVWGRLFLPTYIRDESPQVHVDFLAKRFSSKNEYDAMPRGFAKTTLNQLVLCIVAAHKLRHFTVVLEKTFTEASEVLNVVRDEFSHNELLRIVYGDGVKRDTDGVFDDRNKDAQGDLFIFGVRFRGKGFNTPVRGLKSLEYRPDLILIDDVEEDTHIRSDEQRRKYRENYAQGIVPAVDVDGVIKVTGTILHQDSLLQNLIDQFGGTIYKAFDPTSPTPHLTLLWPARWTWERLMDKKAQMEMEGKGSSKFFQEYCNQPVDDLRRDFKQEHLNRLYTPADIKNLALFRTVTIDPAESTKQGSDYTAVAVVDTDQNNNWYVRFIKRYRVNSAELIELMFELHKAWKPNVMGIERKAFADQIKPFLDIKAQETGEFFTVKELEHGGQRKEDRIRGALQGRFESGKIWFAEGATDDTSILRGELYDFPFGKNDDLCDALSYTQQLSKRPYGGSTNVDSSLIKEFFSFKKKGRSSSLAARL